MGGFPRPEKHEFRCKMKQDGPPQNKNKTAREVRRPAGHILPRRQGEKSAPRHMGHGPGSPHCLFFSFPTPGLPPPLYVYPLMHEPRTSSLLPSSPPYHPPSLLNALSCPPKPRR